MRTRVASLSSKINKKKEPSQQTESSSAVSSRQGLRIRQQARRRRGTKRRRNAEEKYEKKEESIAEAAGCDATESLDAKRARDGGPTACIRGNRRVGASFRLSVAIATSAALWRGERATDGKSLVRTIISRIAILQSGPSRSDALHTHRDVATHPHADFVSVCPYVTLLFVSSCYVTSVLRTEEFLIVSSAFVWHNDIKEGRAYLFQFWRRNLNHCEIFEKFIISLSSEK